MGEYCISTGDSLSLLATAFETGSFKTLSMVKASRSPFSHDVIYKRSWIDMAVEHGHAQILKFPGLPMPSEKSIIAAAQAGHLPVLELYSHMLPDISFPEIQNTDVEYWLKKRTLEVLEVWRVIK